MDSEKFDVGMRIRKDSEYLISERLSNVVDAFEVEYDCLEQLYSGEHSLGL